MSIDTGAVVMSAAIHEGRLTDVHVQSRRPDIGAALCGQSSVVAATTIAMIYSICSKAHAAASRAALLAAGDPAQAIVGRSIDAPTAAEAVRELLFAVLTGECKGCLVSAQRCHQDPGALRSLFEGGLLGMPAEMWLAMSAAQFAAWVSESISPLARESRRRSQLAEPPDAKAAFLPPLDVQNSIAGFGAADPAFAQQPVWMGRPAETGSLARQQRLELLAPLQSQPWLARWTARLAELLIYATGDARQMLGRLDSGGLGSRTGRALIETARGVLVHEVRLRGNTIERYSIVAPTEWNFHPQGPVPDWLEGRPACDESDAKDWMQRAAESLDPCVRCELRVSAST